ncbi:MAG: class I SAM-dependent methyltransferase [Candidatus Omnitrophica bacterium]|nr:class I SAM-dependent methyltransferase [Candidatus Omnitrophota bacterium]
MKKGKKDLRDTFLSLVPQEVKKVLDVGCAKGDLGAKLKQRKIEVIGIEKNKDLCAEAHRKLDRAYLMDAEKLEIPYPNGYFDCILYADVIEHLCDPLTALKNQKKYLKEGGYVVASIPNIRYYKVIIRLLFGGTWDYAKSGILDKGHLRFFTLLNIKELFTKAGFEIIDIRRNIIAATGFKILNALCFNNLKDLLTYQFYIVAIHSPGQKIPIKERKVYQF